MYILGISCYYHDAAAVLLKDGVIVAAAEEERFSRIKHDFSFPQNAIDFCLEYGGITARDLDYVAFYEKPFYKFERILMGALQTFPKSWRMFGEAMTNWLSDKLWVKNTIRDRLGVDENRILFGEHHLSHAASAFYPSPFEEAAILTVDGVGEWATMTRGIGYGNTIHIWDEIKYPHSLGLLYSAFTAFLGFQVNEGEYKVMGMAPYGKPIYADKIYKNLIDVADDGSFRLNMDYFSYHYSDEKTFNGKFEDLFGYPRPPEMPFSLNDNISLYYADVAASIQRVTEEVLLKLANSLYQLTGMQNLCIAGGVGLNSVANGRILMETPFSNIFVQPAAGDSGGALGVALQVYHDLLNKPRKFVIEHAFWGEGYSGRGILGFLIDNNIKYEELKLDKIVDDLVNGKVVGWFQDRFEWGPRALGNRSILADPRSESMKDLVNAKIKFREPFRPFAPVILEGKVADYFDYADVIVKQYPSRYMLLVLPLKKDKADKIGAVNHMGTGRLQTIREEWNPMYYQLVKRFGEATGVSVLLNTSFNLRGEPIVASPQDAFNTFRRSGIDVLVLGNFIIRK